jgi:thiamine kinase-like enzyme
MWTSPPKRASPILDHDLQARWQRWSTGPDPHLLRTPAPQALGCGDPSLANILWDGTHLAMLDFEYAGWTDPAYELADLIEHPHSRGTPDHTWDTFTDRFTLDPTARARHHAARRMFSLFWLARADQRPATQAERAQHLLSQ